MCKKNHVCISTRVGRPAPPSRRKAGWLWLCVPIRIIRLTINQSTLPSYLATEIMMINNEVQLHRTSRDGLSCGDSFFFFFTIPYVYIYACHCMSCHALHMLVAPAARVTSSSSSSSSSSSYYLASYLATTSARCGKYIQTFPSLLGMDGCGGEGGEGGGEGLKNEDC